MESQKMMEAYLNRILPVVGRHLLGKKIAFFNLQMTHLVAEMFARCGVKKFLFIDSSRVEKRTNMALAYGLAENEHQKSGAVLEKVFRNHNQFERGWTFVNHPLETGIESLIRLLAQEKPDLLVTGGNPEECRRTIFLSRWLGVPAVAFSFFPGSEGKSLISLVDPPRKITYSVFDELGKSIAGGKPCRLDFLETSDLAGSLAKAVLLKGTPFERADLRDIIYAQGRNNIVRGKEGWPWWIFYGSERSGKIMTEMIRNRNPGKKEKNPDRSQRLLLLGCGTASLLAGEAVNHFESICLIDCKPFSVYNPVRQLASTRHINGPLKPFIIQEILSERFIGNEKAIRRETDLGVSLKSSRLELFSSGLKLSEKDAASVDRFKKILDRFEPTIAVVGIGRPKDDNFVAASILRERNIKHIVPGLFPLATHFKHIVVDGSKGPCYGCFQNRLPIDTEGAAELSEEQRQMFYGEGSFEEGTQPATIFETMPSVHSALRLAVELSLPESKRSQWFARCLQAEQNCFVGANIRIKKDGNDLYGVPYPGQVVVYSTRDLIGLSERETCIDCGREYEIGEGHVLA